MRLPTTTEIRDLHRRHAPTPELFELVYGHCEIVWRVAERILAGKGGELAVDVDLVRAGALLHDIGVYRLYDAAGVQVDPAYVRHGVLGHEMLASAGFPQALCRFCSHHTGVGISRADVLAQALPLPAADYLAETDEERLVMYADKFHSKTTPPSFVTAEAFTAHIARFGQDKPAAFAAMRQTFGDPDLTALAARHGHLIR